MARWAVVLTMGLVLAAAGPIAAEEELEAIWVSPGLESVSAVAASPLDGSCWVIDSGTVVHLSASGEELWRGASASDLALDPSDGSVWITGDNAAIHLGPDGSELGRTSIGSPRRISLNAADGSVWVSASKGLGDSPDPSIIHLSAIGEVLGSSPGVSPPPRPLADPTDGSCVYQDGAADQLVRLASDGTEVWRGGPNTPLLALNPANRTLWAQDADHLALLSPTGEMLWQSEWTSMGVFTAAVDPRDGSCWTSLLANGGGASLLHLAADGTQLAEWPGYEGIDVIAVSPFDNTLWMRDFRRLTHLTDGGEVLWRSVLYTGPTSLSINAADGSCWIGLSQNAGVVHVSASGVELTRVMGFPNELRVAVNSTDGSCWVADSSNHVLVHLAEDGSELLRIDLTQCADLGNHVRCLAVDPSSGMVWTATDGNSAPFTGEGEYLRDAGMGSAYVVAVDPSDGGVWYTSYTAYAGGATHLLPGEGVWWASGLSYPTSLSPDSRDHSAWVNSRDTDEVVHLASDCTELLRVGGAGQFGRPIGVAADPNDGSCWVVDENPGSQGGSLVHLEADGSERYRGDGAGGLTSPSLIAVDPYDGSLWVASGVRNCVVHLRMAGSWLFSDIARDFWAHDAIVACADAGIVAGYPDGAYHPEREVTRDQMAVYISRALAGGDGEVQVPSGVAEPTFGDVGEDHWAYRYVEYCAAAGVVQGYPDGGYHPDETVNRGQMAVYIARAVVSPTGDAAVPDPPAEATFSDVTADNEWAWCYRHVEYCAAEGVVQGYWDGSYRPEAAVTRDQMAVYVQRAFGLPM
jgi:DNA-binding beta-propeller fold protein YncE